MNRLKKILLVSMSFVLILSACGGYEKGTDDYKKEENIATAESAEKTAKDYNRELEDKITAIQKLIDENYIDVKRIIPTQFNYELVVDAILYACAR